ncbi:YjfB family protein [Clostridium saccharobutylicum]|uniref:Putative motility protein n=1 Tax=Clostridium saccharobutylicum DSM 13864 TaxID=1345695 RepID=U5MVX4_CLOSA|nr:YjfB family protein [Clostridium saccharobutylicum]AGX44904.1 putative motility protein [Clostridium saccharobutylicum DSM 13864]AQR92185.1 hypothetical protein CLOSC_39150 [Clostridium saccharobutylicum]AQS02087.1 hypothetical protein CSACC_39200 [Clostridium saccharobutylicum]AQS11691.1 hypothetical protein CLOBY_38490 [Clostridium saccharobutylicum]AQS16070.1 hypothetical protein CLOSACC_39200 [Clostridium saccharobutylicum]
MDIAELSMVMSQSRIGELAGISVMKLAMNTGNENSQQMIETIRNVAVDPDRGNYIDVSI